MPRPPSDRSDLPLVTVVTVVHNGEHFLAECADSVLRQTYSNWEYVVVDNCSTDRTPEIAERLARADPRVRYDRRDDFVGVVESHNRGFRAIRPETAYVKFVGADDWLYPESLERMVELGEREPAVGVISAYRLNGTRVDLVNLPYTQSTERGRTMVARGLVSPTALMGSPTALLLRANVVRSREPFYDGSFRHADAEAGYWALMQSDYGLVHQVLTYNREQMSPETSVSSRLSTFEPERIRMLLRYGPQTMSPEEYRRAVRAKLSRYVAYHRRRFVWRHTKGHFRREALAGDAELRRFHRDAVDLIVAESGGDQEIERIARVLRLLLR